MKKTALEFYEIEIDYLIEKYEAKEISQREFMTMKHNLFYQAKEKEKQEHSETWDNSLIENKGDNYIGKEKSFEEYYNENF